MGGNGNTTNGLARSMEKEGTTMTEERAKMNRKANYVEGDQRDKEKENQQSSEWQSSGDRRRGTCWSGSVFNGIITT